MMPGQKGVVPVGLKTVNTILYCKEWKKTDRFYRECLGLPVHFSTSWFVEFFLTATSRLSIADEKKASIKSCGGSGITIAFEVDDIETNYHSLLKMELRPSAIRQHLWNARVFYLFDPEGHRIEFWQRTATLQKTETDTISTVQL